MVEWGSRGWGMRGHDRDEGGLAPPGGFCSLATRRRACALARVERWEVGGGRHDARGVPRAWCRASGGVGALHGRGGWVVGTWGQGVSVCSGGGSARNVRWERVRGCLDTGPGQRLYSNARAAGSRDAGRHDQKPSFQLPWCHESGGSHVESRGRHVYGW
ncbi:hypothetical protein PVAP13_9NG154873 [Panicum virgatum]|uniref:Uncharacterized protein n=1 Tax=Panicum virgatum TaxID=38727 RepID=A0A8T0MLL9_PANVG|nr:hypothetical protein PVAP13_9NG154873 [Panicum virgatum]